MFDVTFGIFDSAKIFLFLDIAEEYVSQSSGASEFFWCYEEMQAQLLYPDICTTRSEQNCQEKSSKNFHH